MIVEENVLYLRFILLLIQGGTELLRKITEKALRKMKTALHPFLSSIKIKLMISEDLSKKQKRLLYPTPYSGPDIKDFDITVLSFLILNYFRDVLDGNERNAAKQLRHIRNKYHAHVSDPSMTIATYTKEWTTVSNIIFTVAHGLPDEDKKKLLHIINNVTDDQFKLETVVEKLKEFDTSNDFYSSIRKKLDEITKDVENIKAEQIKQREEQIKEKEERIKQRELIAVVDTRSLETENEVLELRKELSALKRQLENQGRNTTLKNVTYGKVHANAGDQKTTEEAESCLLRASKESIKEGNGDKYSPSKLKEKTDGFIADVEKLNVKVTGVKDGSVVFEFTSSSLDALIDLLDYFCSSCFRARLDGIAKALEHVVGKEVYLFGFIDLESLRNVIKKLHHLEHERTVQFEMECAGLDGLLHVLGVFEEDKAANSLNELSKALSETVKKPVTLRTSIDIDQMHRAIDSLKKHIALENANEIDRRNESCSADSGLESGIHTTIKSTDKEFPDESLAAELSEPYRIGKSLEEAKMTFPGASQPHATMTSLGTKQPLFVDQPKGILSEYPDDQNVLKDNKTYKIRNLHTKCKMRPSEINFLNKRFRAKYPGRNRTIFSTFEALKYGKLKIQDIPKIRVFCYRNECFSPDTRGLYLFQMYAQWYELVHRADLLITVIFIERFHLLGVARKLGVQRHKICHDRLPKYDDFKDKPKKFKLVLRPKKGPSKHFDPSGCRLSKGDVKRLRQGQDPSMNFDLRHTPEEPSEYIPTVKRPQILLGDYIEKCIGDQLREHLEDKPYCFAGPTIKKILKRKVKKAKRNEKVSPKMSDAAGPKKETEHKGKKLVQSAARQSNSNVGARPKIKPTKSHSSSDKLEQQNQAFELRTN